MLKKLLLIFCLMVLIPNSSLAENSVLMGNVEFTLDFARNEAFKSVNYQMPRSEVRPHLYDKNFKENQNAIKYNLKLKDRELKLYSMQYYKTYGVEYVNDKTHTYFYWQNSGFLKSLAVTQAKSGNNYPSIVYYYDPKGNLVNVNYAVSLTEEYIFNKDGSFNCHWIDGKAYDENGKKIGDSRGIEPVE